MGSRSERIVLDEDTVIGDYEIVSLLGQGGYGDVYKAKKLSTGEFFALKTEYVTAPKKALAKEISFLGELDSPYFPRIYASGQDGNVMYAVMDLFGKSIADYKKSLFVRTISPPLLATMGIEMIKAIEAFHEAGFVHRDIKPSNFLLSKNPEAPIALIDFGLSHIFIDEDTGRPYPPNAKPHFGGTKKYVSIRLHDHKDSSKCDDLASWFYAMVEGWKGKLPWGNVRDKDEVGDRKRSITPSELCSGMPIQFRELYTYINHLDYYDVPDYDMIISTLQSILANNYPNSIINLNDFYYSVHKDEKKPLPIQDKQAADDENHENMDEQVPGCCLII